MSVIGILVEHFDDRGHLKFRERLTLNAGNCSFIVGRSVAADVTLDDDHAAPMHARLEVTADGQLLVTDLGSINGVIIDGTRHFHASSLAVPANLLQIGATHVRVRSTSDRLAPEKPYSPIASSGFLAPAWIAGFGLCIVTSQVIFTSWISAPSDLEVAVSGALAVSALLIAVWVAMWSLLSRILRGEWRWQRHAAVVLAVIAVLTALDDVLEFGWFLIGLPPWGMRTWWLLVIALSVVLHLHLTHASTRMTRRKVIAACVIPAILAGASIWLFERYQGRDVNYINAQHRIYPPQFRMSATITPEAYFKTAVPLREAADKKRQALQPDETGEDE